MKKNTVTPTPATSKEKKTAKASAVAPATDKKKPAQDLDKANAKAAIKEVTERELLYQYPKSDMSQKEKKDFRRSMRSKIKSFNRQLMELRKDESPDAATKRKLIEKERQAWVDSHLTKFGAKEKIA